MLKAFLHLSQKLWMARSNYKPKRGHKLPKVKMVDSSEREKKREGKKGEKTIGNYLYIL